MKVTANGKKFGKHEPGVIFEFPDKVARVLIAVGKLREVTVAIAAQPEPTPDISPRTGQPKRAYRRRDMQAGEA